MHTRDVLARCREHGANDVGDVDIVSNTSNSHAALQCTFVELLKLVRFDFEYFFENRAGYEAFCRDACATPYQEGLKVYFLVATHIAVDDEVANHDVRKVEHLLQDPVAYVPGARRGHILTSSITGFVDEVDVDV